LDYLKHPLLFSSFLFIYFIFKASDSLIYKELLIRYVLLFMLKRKSYSVFDL